MGQNEYQEVEPTWRISDFEYLKALHTSTGKNVLLRRAPGNSEYKSLQLKKELQQHLRFRLPNVWSPLSVHGDSMVFNDTDGRSLRQILKNKELSTTDILGIAIQLVDTFYEFHQQNKRHLTIILDQLILANDKTVKILPVPYFDERNKEKYQAPEALVHKGKDYDLRSDLYKFGLLLYELFTNGKTPFPGNEEKDWRHNHIAVEPVPLTRMNRTIPKMVSKIILTLLNKDPDKRYQCTQHLAKDLLICWKELSENGNIQPFRLSLGSFDGDFSIPTAFYGRETEMKALYDVFQRAAFGSAELVFVSGPAGIGKTTLVKNQFRSMVQHRAYIGCGKFDQMQQKIPYYSLVEAFRDIVTQILMQSDEQVEEWKNNIQDAVGNNGRILTDVIPELAALIGEQPPVEVVSDAESANRFIQVFNQFVQVFANVNHPLVLFLDDIHWADYASLKLVYSLLTNPNSHRFMVIGSCRKNEFAAFDLVYHRLKQMDQFGVKTTEIDTSHLSITEVEQFIADTLESSLPESKGLAQLIYRKTAGNPLYMKQLLQLIQSEQWIHFDSVSQKWNWDEIAIQGVKDHDQIIEYMMEKIDQSPPKLIEVLKVAACLGYAFYENDLNRFSTLPAKDVQEGLVLAQQEGLILSPDLARGKKRYQFFHNQIQQMAYAFVRDSEKQAIHLKIGRFLGTVLSTDKSTDNILFKAVNHYNKGMHLITEAEEQEKLLTLNYRAAQKAKSAAAYHNAKYYYRHAIQFIDQEKWTNAYDFCYQLFLEVSNVEYLCGNFEVADAINADLLQMAKGWRESALVYRQKITQLISQEKYKEAIEMGIFSVAQVGVKLPLAPDNTELKEAIRRTRQLFPNGFEALRNLPDATNEDMKQAMNIMVQLMLPAFFQNRSVFVLIVNKLMELIMQHGKIEDAPTIYARYGLFLCAGLEEFDKSYEIGKIAVELADQQAIPSVQCKVYIIFGGVICSWYKDVQQGEEYVKKAIDLGLSVGDLITTNMAVGKHINMVYPWQSLDAIIETNKNYLDILDQTNDHFLQNSVYANIQFARCLQGLTNDRLTLNDSSFDEDSFIDTVRKKDRGKGLIFQYLTYKLQIHYINGEYQSAVNYALKAEDYLDHNSYLSHYGEYLFYKALSILKAWQSFEGDEQKHLLREMAKILRKFSIWRQHNPVAFEHREWLLRAEYATMQDFPEKAELLYEQAIKSAKKSHYDQNLAITYELAAQFYLEQGKSSMIQNYLEEAVLAYTKWGARPKAKAIRETYSEYFPTEKQEALLEHTDDDAFAQAELEAYPINNLANIMKASESLSSDMDFNHSLKELMFSIKRESLAEKAVLFTKEDNAIIVTSIVKGTTEFSLLAERLEESAEVPQQIVRFVDRTKKMILIDDMLHHQTYQQDSYMRKQMPRSVLCLPILFQGQFKGILYLENRWIANLFSEEQANVIKYLGTQAMFVTKLMETFDVKEANQTNVTTIEEEEPNPDMMILDELTERELEIINLMAAGLSNQEIARTLGLKVGTVKVHNHNIFSKLDVNRRTKAVFKAKELKLIDNV
ncbi:AAA family ATPase [Aquibacillus albus]|uniref:ATPase/DNA-binding CsgD family transcriptional regulator n=1 Tax=Aquibacillus albus TaxID=1168171 RepID=A0ABS2N649_9BACI|nr:AAA family ATPase [Aquibacillus albus]MBM7573518.1 putative ATPase/DNA-binding CsgD family transcriptional regulator [Aquibacillus albus]